MIELSRRMARVQASAIREILKVTERPEVLSFAGGLPAPEAFPVEALARAHAEVLSGDGAASALQYGPTEGYTPLRAWVAERMTRRGLPASTEQVLITAGSQQGIDLVAKALIDEGDRVLVEAPSYLAALQTFSTYEAHLEAVETDEEGMRVDALERALREQRPKLVYLVPNFQNPRGTTLGLERRLRIAQLAAEHGVTVLEDDPYAELRYRGAALPPIAGIEPLAKVIHLGTFSKTLAPGLRLGYLVAEERMARALTIAKQAVDLHTGTLAQRAAFRLLETFDYEAHLRRLRGLYAERLDAMLASIEHCFPQGTTWTRPEGGMFVWMHLPGGIDARELLADAMRERVAFVPGAPFYPQEPRPETLRLNFSNRPPLLIAEGMARLGGCVRARLEQMRADARPAERVPA
jgi:2-aminoadipate transaminase